MNLIQYFIGIDVQISKGCSFFVLNRNAEYVDSGWITFQSIKETAEQLRKIIRKFAKEQPETVAVGIDAPRNPLLGPREQYWDGKKGLWRKRKPSEKGWGRHCEVVLKSLGIANPQWTRILSDSPEWMKLGFQIFKVLKGQKHCYEVFSSASYKMLQNDENLKISINFSQFYPDPKDMIDACIAAVTVYEYIQGSGAEVGGGDGLGSIILPRPLTDISSPKVLGFPSKI